MEPIINSLIFPKIPQAIIKQLEETEALCNEIYEAISPLISNVHPEISTKALGYAYAVILCQLLHKRMAKEKHADRIEEAVLQLREHCKSALDLIDKLHDSSEADAD